MRFKGNFWLVAKSVQDIKAGKFKIVGQKIPCDDDGNANGLNRYVRADSHEKLLDHYKDNDWFKCRTANSYPKGSVAVYNGHAFVKLPRSMYTETVLNKIAQEYSLVGLLFVREYETEYNDYKLR